MNESLYEFFNNPELNETLIIDENFNYEKKVGKYDADKYLNGKALRDSLSIRKLLLSVVGCICIAIFGLGFINLLPFDKNKLMKNCEKYEDMVNSSPKLSKIYSEIKDIVHANPSSDTETKENIKEVKEKLKEFKKEFSIELKNEKQIKKEITK